MNTTCVQSSQTVNSDFFEVTYLDHVLLNTLLQTLNHQIHCWFSIIPQFQPNPELFLSSTSNCCYMLKTTSRLVNLSQKEKKICWLSTQQEIFEILSLHLICSL